MAAPSADTSPHLDLAKDPARLFLAIGRKPAAALVLRAVLRAIPLVPIFAASKIALLSAVLRMCSTVHFSLKYELETPKREILLVADMIEELSGTVNAPTVSAASLMSSILHGTKEEWHRLAASCLESVLRASSNHSFYTSKHRPDRYDDSALAEAMQAFQQDVAVQQSGASGAELVRLSLWPSAKSSAPTWVLRPWKNLSKDLLARGTHWQSWIDWYDALLVGSTQPLQWDAAFVSQDGGEQLPWDEGPRAVNEKIAERLAARNKNSTDAVLSARTQRRVDADALSQGPSTYYFEWRGEQLEAIPLREAPFNITLAQQLASEIVRKAHEALGTLRGNNADEVVQRSLERLLAIARLPVDEIPEGLLLSRFNTLAAHARAFSDAATGRDRETRAAIDDVAVSVGNLVDCYPGIRIINANRVALDLQAESAQVIEVELRAIAEFARSSPSVGESARSALETGRDEVDELTAKIGNEPSASKAASYVMARGLAVAARLADVTNFISVTLKQGAAELSELRNDTWREIRKKVPKATAAGVAKGAENAAQEGLAILGKLPVIALAYWIDRADRGACDPHSALECA